MKKYKKLISELLVVAIVVTGLGFSTLANSLNEENGNKLNNIKN